MMVDEEVSKYRSEVIEKFINLETVINAIISQHYFGKVRFDFLTEVLYDEYFSFGLKRRILERIVPDIDKEKLQGLCRLNIIRNYFAHCNQEFFPGSSKPTKETKGFVLDPRNLKKPVDFKALYSEFTAKEKEVTLYLFELYKKRGGVAGEV